MITINYQAYGTKGFQLRLRLYQDGETKFISVTRLLKGSIQKHHWNQKKQIFNPSCPYCDENNSILSKFLQRYREAAIEWKGTLWGFISSMEDQEEIKDLTLSEFIHQIAERSKKNTHADGTIKSTFEEYLKIDKRLQEFCKAKHIDYNQLYLKEITSSFVNNVLNWVESSRKGVGLRYISKGLHSIVMKADKEDYLDADDFKKCRWHKDSQLSSQKFNTLTDEQIKKFMDLDLCSITKSQYNELYRDFCLFILYTGQSACDAIALRNCDKQIIGGLSHFVFRRRKIAEKQIVPCAVPISKEMEAIIKKWQWRAADGYIFPVRSCKKIRQQATNNGDIRHFIGNLNGWLKKVGKALGCQFPLRSYTFRHTAITRYVSQGIPMAYLSNMMGTSIENIEKIYYNNLGDISSRNKVLSAMAI